MERREKLDEIQTRESNSQTQAFHAVDTGNENGLPITDKSEESIESKVNKCPIEAVEAESKSTAHAGHQNIRTYDTEPTDEVSYDFDTQSITTTSTEQLTPKSLFQDHILKGSATFHMTPCCAIVSAIGNCSESKYDRLTHFFEKSVKTRNGQVFSPQLQLAYERKDPDSLSQFELVVLGNYPFNDFAWRISTSLEDTAILGLLSYYSNIVKTRKLKTLEFLPNPTMMNELSNPHTVTEENAAAAVDNLYKKTAKGWKKIHTDKSLLHQLRAGISLINILDIGTGQGVQDFLPFLNQYCKQSMHLTCYQDEFIAETSNQSGESGNNSPTNNNDDPKHALCQLKGCVNNEQIIIATKLETNERVSRKVEQDEIETAIKNTLGDDHSIERLSVPEGDSDTNPTKKYLEKTVAEQAHFHTVVYLREILLLETIRRQRKHSFWMKRSQVEELAQQLLFMNGSVLRFLRLFTSFGSLFYANDIPSLNEYIITDVFKFVQQIQKLYNYNPQNEPLAKYGLFEERSDSAEDDKVIFRFLTALKIAVRVRGTQIQTPSGAPVQSTHYYYIPNARSMHKRIPSTRSEATPEHHNDTLMISFNKCVAENLQVVLCHEVLQMGGQLIPTEEANATIVRACKNNPQIRFKEFIKDVEVTILSQQNDIQGDVIGILNRVLPRYLKTASEAKLSYKITKTSENLGEPDDFQDTLNERKNKTHCKINHEINPIDVGHIAALLWDKYHDDMHQLKRLLSPKPLPAQTPEQETEFGENNRLKVLYMLMEYLKDATTKEFEELKQNLQKPY